MSILNNKANLFIVGSMKCGTTILFDYLCQHPDIYGYPEKEIHYFTLNRSKDQKWYNKHFKGGIGKTYKLDASPTYFDMSSSSSVAKLIDAYNPESKIIEIIRDPVLRAISHFNHLKIINKISCLADITEDEFFSRDFESAKLSKIDIDHYLNIVLEFSQYSKKLHYYSSVFSKERFFLLTNKDLADDAKNVMENLFDFLDLDNIESPLFGERKYDQGTSISKISLELQRKLYDFFSEDFYHAARFEGAERISKNSETYKCIPNGLSFGEAVVGENGWMFLDGGSNNVLEYFYEKTNFTYDDINIWKLLLLKRANNISELGAEYHHIVIPEKITVYDKSFPYTVDWTRSPGNRLLNSIKIENNITVIDIISIFRKHKHDYNLYHRTDSHWNQNGAYLAYQKICYDLGVEAKKSILQTGYKDVEWQFDLGANLPEPIREKVRIYNILRDAELVWENSIVHFKKQNKLCNEVGLHVGSAVRFENPKASEARNVLLFGDSFCEYRPVYLTGMLAETFSKVTFIWSSSIDYKMVEIINPDIVLTALTERFMRVIPNDLFDLSIYENDAIKKYKDRIKNIKTV